MSQTTRIVLFSFILLLCSTGVYSAEPFRQWRAKSGATAEARLLEADETEVRLLLRNRKTVTVLLADLADHDRDYAQRFRADRDKPKRPRPADERVASAGRQVTAIFTSVIELLEKRDVLKKSGRPVKSTTLPPGHMLAPDIAKVDAARGGSIRDRIPSPWAIFVSFQKQYYELLPIVKEPGWRPQPAERAELVKLLQRTEAFLTGKVSANPEEALALYDALDPFWRLILKPLALTAADDCHWPPAAMLLAIGERCWPPPTDFDAASLRKKARDEFGRPVRSYSLGRELPAGSMHQIGFSRDGRLMTTSESVHSGGRQGNYINLWEVATARKIADLAAPKPESQHGSLATDAAFGPHGRQLLVAGDRYGAALYDTRTGALIQDLDLRMDHDDSQFVRYVDWSRSGLSLAFSSIHNYQIANVLRGTGDQSWHSPTEFSGSNHPAFSPDGYTVFSKAGNRWWTSRTRPPLPDSNLRISATAFSEGGETMAMLARGSEYRALLWDWHSLKLRANVAVPYFSSRQPIFEVSPDGRYLLLATENGPTSIWDVANEKTIRKFPGAWAAMFHPSGMYVAVRSAKHVLLWPTGLAPTRDATGEVELEDVMPGKVAMKLPKIKPDPRAKSKPKAKPKGKGTKKNRPAQSNLATINDQGFELPATSK